MNLKTGGRAKSIKVYMKKIRTQAKKDRVKLNKRFG
jgi:hypothetical protein